MSKAAIEVITSVQRRRRWSMAEKEQLVAASLEPGAGVSAVARDAGIQPGQLYGWRRQHFTQVLHPQGGSSDELCGTPLRMMDVDAQINDACVPINCRDSFFASDDQFGAASILSRGFNRAPTHQGSFWTIKYGRPVPGQR